jgi:hypothetical protein
MEIDKSHQADSINGHAIATTDGQQQPAPNVYSAEDEQRTKDHGNEEQNDDDGDSDSDSGPITCPLFMEGLPIDFSTNPQLAAIASLLEDDVREENAKDDKTEEENDTKDKSGDASKNDQHCTPFFTPHTTSSTRHWKNSAKTQNRRRRQRASPYPRQQDRKDEKQATTSKSPSVGEITLFMNMWKP